MGVYSVIVVIHGYIIDALNSRNLKLLVMPKLPKSTIALSALYKMFLLARKAIQIYVHYIKVNGCYKVTRIYSFHHK